MLLLLAACRTPISTTDSGAPTGTHRDPVGGTFRVVTWNVETLGVAGTPEHEAVRAALARIDADVVALNELVSLEENDLEDLAEALGMDFFLTPDDNPFGPQRNGLMSRLPVVDSEIWTSSALSGDDRANDLTRWPLSVTVEVGEKTASVVVEHWQSGFYDSDVFRRVVDAERVGQAAAEVGSDAVVVVGDFNAEIDEEPGSPAEWTSIPSGMPSGFWLGADLYDRLDAGIPNNPFSPLQERGFEPVETLQRDGRTATRDSSGRHLDWIWIRDAEAEGGEIYDARDDDGGGLPKAGEAPPRETTANAADHFPVFADLSL